jgi:putative peptide zinc metalloprotease protein
LRSQRPRALAVTCGALASVAVVLFALRLPYGTVTEGVVWAPSGADLRAGVDGTLVDLAAAPDARLAAGAAVARLSDPVLDARVRVMQARLTEVELRLTAAEPSDQVQAQMLRQQVGYFRSDLNDALMRQKAMELNTPVAGRFLVSLPRDLRGKYVRRGELIGYALGEDTATVRIIVPQSEIELVREDMRGVDLRFASDPMRVVHVGQVAREVPTATRQLPSTALSTMGGGPIAIDPTDEQHLRALEMVFQMDVKLPASEVPQRIGERVYVRFQHDDRTLAWRIGRTLRQMFLKRFDL